MITLKTLLREMCAAAILSLSSILVGFLRHTVMLLFTLLYSQHFFWLDFFSYSLIKTHHSHGRQSYRRKDTRRVYATNCLYACLYYELQQQWNDHFELGGLVDVWARLSWTWAQRDATTHLVCVHMCVEANAQCAIQHASRHRHQPTISWMKLHHCKRRVVNVRQY